MASKVQKLCKICGKMFTPCSDCENDNVMFRWKKVACSPECAKKYFAKIEESRQHKTKIIETQSTKTENMEVIDTTLKTTTENTKSNRTRRKNIENKEREQID